MPDRRGGLGTVVASPGDAGQFRRAIRRPADGVTEATDGKRIRRVVPTSVAPITFFLREECDWMQSRHEDDGELGARGLSAPAREVLEFLRKRGASFFADIVRGTGKLKAEVETGLWELVAAGRVTADGFDNLRALIDPRRRAGHGSQRTARPRHATGRWSLLYAGEPAERTRQIEATCWMLLHRYGVVFRELLARETGLPRWRELQVALRRLEDRGEIRGGRFIAGFIGEQFALPVAVESLRELRRLELSQGERAAPELITDLSRRSAEPGRNHRAGRTRSRHLRTASDAAQRDSQRRNPTCADTDSRSRDVRRRIWRNRQHIWRAMLQAVLLELVSKIMV